MAGFFSSLGKFFTGTPEKRENVSTLRPEQEGLYQQLINASMGQGAGGAFGDAADYYRSLLGNDSADYEAFANPMLRQYFQDIVPNISEQFAGMGSGALSSSGFMNAQNQAGVDLSERLAALRANLRQQGAQGLQNLGGLGLQNFSQNMVTQPGTQGFLGNIFQGLDQAFGGPLVSKALGSFSSGNSVGANTSPYGAQGPVASPTLNNSRSNLPTFLQNQ